MKENQPEKPKCYGVRIEEVSPFMTSGYNAGNVHGYSITEAIYKEASRIGDHVTIYAGGTAVWKEGDTTCHMRLFPTPNVTVA